MIGFLQWFARYLLGSTARPCAFNSMLLLQAFLRKSYWLIKARKLVIWACHCAMSGVHSFQNQQSALCRGSTASTATHSRCGAHTTEFRVLELHSPMPCCCMQAEKQTLEEQLNITTADASTLRTELQQSVADCHDLTQMLSSSQAELHSSVEQTQRQDEQLQGLRSTAAAQEAESAAELNGAKAQMSQLARQLSERIQRLDALQVPCCGSPWCAAPVCLQKMEGYNFDNSNMIMLKTSPVKMQHVVKLL